MNDWIEPFNDPARGKPVSIMAGVYPRNNRWTIKQYSKGEFNGITTMTQHFRRHGYLTLGGGKIYPPLRSPERHWDVFEPYERPRDQKRTPGVLLNQLTGMHRAGRRGVEEGLRPAILSRGRLSLPTSSLVLAAFLYGEIPAGIRRTVGGQDRRSRRRSP